MNEFRELRRGEFEKFLEAFSRSGTLKYRNNKWGGLNRKGEPFTVHVKHGSTRKYSRRLIETIAGDLGVSREEFTQWYLNY